MLYHISEEPCIERFDPRPMPDVEGAVVWAISAERLQNYLLPRDCPRVTFFAGARAQPADIERYLGSSIAVVAFEAGWLDRVRRARLYCYHLPESSFNCVDKTAGYFQSKESVVPQRIDVMDDLLSELATRGVEIRILPSLWALHDAIPKSTLDFSIIRFRNAAPRGVGQTLPQPAQTPSVC